MSARKAKAVEALVDAEVIPAEEYASVTISIDHLLARANETGHTVIKNVWSTETAAQSLRAQLAYFKMRDLLDDDGNYQLVAKAMDTGAVLVLTVGEELTNVIVDAAIWTGLLDEESVLGASLNPGGTVLGAHAALITLATDLKRSASAEGKDITLLGFLTN